MQEQFVTYEIALALKELGFDEPCFGRWFCGDNEFEPSIFFNQDYKNRVVCDNRCTEGYSILAPLWQQGIDWLWDKHSVFVQITRNKPGYDEFRVEIYKTNETNTYIHLQINEGDSRMCKWFDTPQEAREQAILKAIELCKN